MAAVATNSPTGVVRRPSISPTKRWSKHRSQRGAVELPDVLGLAATGLTTWVLWPSAVSVRDRVRASGKWTLSRRAKAAAPLVAAVVVSTGVGVGTNAAVASMQEPPLPAISSASVPVVGAEPESLLVIGNPLEDPAIAQFPLGPAVTGVELITSEYSDGTRCSDITALTGSSTRTAIGSVNLTSDRRQVLAALGPDERCPAGANIFSVQRRPIERSGR